MATRSTIAMKTEDGIYSVYCHWDGYVEHNGRILLNHYTDTALVKALIDLGDLSTLSESLDDVQAYHRNKGEEWADVSPQTFSDVPEWIELAQGIEFFYLWNGKEWLVSTGQKVNGYPTFEFVEVAILEQLVEEFQEKLG
tara:strand:+ start:473 stop:892 length:420 start_codon:yes stop_codon:yes gene_type:complete